MTGRMGFSRTILRMGGMALAMAALSGCDGAPGLGFLKSKDKPAADQSAPVVDRDIEAPDVFQKTEAGLWDGRPSLGGVWVAHPDVTDPQRVIIRNTANGESVVGALFRRERDLPGPRFQVSSEAAGALSMLAGAPVELNVTALMRNAAPGDDTEDDAAIAGIQPETAETDTDPRPQPADAASSLAEPYIQTGIFSLKANAERSAAQMREAGLTPTVRQSSGDGRLWRVLVGPASTESERTTLLKQVQSAGFPDAYAVTD